MKKLLSCLVIVGIAFGAHAEPYPEGYGDDRAAIIDLQGRYLLAMDFHDPEAYAAVFAEDGVLDWAGGVIEGRQAIYEFMASGRYDPTRDATPATDPTTDEDWPAASRHYISNQVIEIEGNTARAITYWTQLNNNADRGTLTWGLFGTYEDELEKIDGEWRFTRRAIYNEGLPGRHRAGMANPLPPR